MDKQIQALDMVLSRPTVAPADDKAAGLPGDDHRAASMATGAPVPDTRQSREQEHVTAAPVTPPVPEDIERTYRHVGSRFYATDRANFLAFRDKGHRLGTRSDNAAIALSMVRVAHARGWDEITVSGSPAFRASVRQAAADYGVRVQDDAVKQFAPELPPEPDSQARRRLPVPGSPRQQKMQSGWAAPLPSNEHRAMRDAFNTAPERDALERFPTLAGAYAAVIAIDKKAQTDGLTWAQRAIVTARVRQNILDSLARGQVPDVQLRPGRERPRLHQHAVEADR